MSDLYRPQHGSTLILCLIMLAAATALFMASLHQSLLNIRMVGHEITRDIVFHTTSSEIIAQYNYLSSRVSASQFLKDASEKFEIILPVRGTFEDITLTSKLQLVPSNIRLDHSLQEGFSSGLFYEKNFDIVVYSQLNQSIESKQKVNFSYLSRARGI